MNDQTQKAGNYSTNIQAESLVVHQGPSVTEVRELALDVFRSNFDVLTSEAMKVAGQRAEEITERFLERLQQQNPEGLRQAQEPDFQYALLRVQGEHARCGDGELGDLLVDLLVDRTKYQSRSILQIVLNESLSIAPKLTADQIAALSTIFIFKRTSNTSVRSPEALWEYLDGRIAPIASLISDKESCYQHLEYSGCGMETMSSFQLAEFFRRKYGGLFSKGLDVAEIEQLALPVALDHAILIPCFNDPTRFQVNAQNAAGIAAQCRTLGVDEEGIPRIVAAFNSNSMGLEEIKNKVIDAREYMRRVFAVWDASPMHRFRLTSVGLAIGHANIKKHLRDYTDLSTWIN